MYFVVQLFRYFKHSFSLQLVTEGSVTVVFKPLIPYANKDATIVLTNKTEFRDADPGRAAGR